MDVVLLVEGVSDRVAVETVAARLGRRLDEENVAVVPMGGATSVRRFVERYDDGVRRVLGLCDRNEERHFRRALPDADVFVCDRDLEDELIRSLGADATEAVIEVAGELPSLRRMQNMPFHRGSPREDQLRRFLGTRSGRKERYARLLAEAVDLERLPAPLAGALAATHHPTTG